MPPEWNTRSCLRCPPPAGSPAPRAASTRSRCPRATVRHRLQLRALGRSLGPRAELLAPTPRRRGIRSGRSASQARSHGSASASVPRARRGSTRRGRKSVTPISPSPANAQVSRALCIGLTSTSANVCLASTGRICSASRRPLSVKGMSVVPVCCPLRLHTVSPCLIAKTFTLYRLFDAEPDNLKGREEKERQPGSRRRDRR